MKIFASKRIKEMFIPQKKKVFAVNRLCGIALVLRTIHTMFYILPFLMLTLKEGTFADCLSPILWQRAVWHYKG